MNEPVVGDLVYLTPQYHDYMHKKHPDTGICFINRIAKLEMIVDWKSDFGRKIKAARKKSGKWKGLSIEDNKYIFSVFYPDIPGKDGRMGVVERGVPMFGVKPGTDQPFFEKIPEWFYKEIAKQCESFGLEMEVSESVSD